MPYKRYVMGEPPGEAQMNDWENEGWSEIQVIGPCPAQDNDTKKLRNVFVVYLWRSIIGAVRMPRNPPPIQGQH